MDDGATSNSVAISLIAMSRLSTVYLIFSIIGVEKVEKNVRTFELLLNYIEEIG